MNFLAAASRTLIPYILQQSVGPMLTRERGSSAITPSGRAGEEAKKTGAQDIVSFIQALALASGSSRDIESLFNKVPTGKLETAAKNAETAAKASRKAGPPPPPPPASPNQNIIPQEGQPPEAALQAMQQAVGQQPTTQLAAFPQGMGAQQGMQTALQEAPRGTQAADARLQAMASAATPEQAERIESKRARNLMPRELELTEKEITPTVEKNLAKLQAVASRLNDSDPKHMRRFGNIYYKMAGMLYDIPDISEAELTNLAAAQKYARGADFKDLGSPREIKEKTLESLMRLGQDYYFLAEKPDGSTKSNAEIIADALLRGQTKRNTRSRKDTAQADAN